MATSVTIKSSRLQGAIWELKQPKRKKPGGFPSGFDAKITLRVLLSELLRGFDNTGEVDRFERSTADEAAVDVLLC